jgi:Tfp pilus assembly protein PilX
MKHKINQAGASAIMFTMFFVIIISLITIGYATLARRDQQSALNNNLSSEAQYAAETVINSVQNYLKATPNAIASTTCGSNPDTYNNKYKPNFGSADINQTCTTWDFNPTSINFDISQDSVYSFINNNAGAASSLDFTWQPTGGTTGGYYNSPLNTMPDIDTSKNAILKITLSSDLSTPNSQKLFYILPTNTTAPTASYGSRGDIYSAKCNTVAATTVCNVRVSNLPSAKYVNIQSIGVSSNITYKSFSGASLQTISGAMAIVDVNVIVNKSFTKRLQANVSLANTGWQPNSAASAESLCKDFLVDGTQDKGVANPGTPCPILIKE